MAANYVVPLDLSSSEECRSACLMESCGSDGQRIRVAVEHLLNNLSAVSVSGLSHAQPTQSEFAPSHSPHCCEKCGRQHVSVVVQRKLKKLIAAGREALQAPFAESDSMLARVRRLCRSVGERCAGQLIATHRRPRQMLSLLWTAVRNRGCQFLGPALQEEVLRLLLLLLEDGHALSRRVLVMFVVQRLQPRFLHASKTGVGRVVQLLYRASCFQVNKVAGQSSSMQLREQFRHYDSLRRQHDRQIVVIGREAGVSLPPDHWSSVLYGDQLHSSHMQSVIDQLQDGSMQFERQLEEISRMIARNSCDNCTRLYTELLPFLTHLSVIDVSADGCTWQHVVQCLATVKTLLCVLSRQCCACYQQEDSTDILLDQCCTDMISCSVVTSSDNTGDASASTGQPSNYQPNQGDERCGVVTTCSPPPVVVAVTHGGGVITCATTSVMTSPHQNYITESFIHTPTHSLIHPSMLTAITLMYPPADNSTHSPTL